MINDIEDKQPRPERLHNKRMGRELAMQFLFQCSLTGEKFSAARWNTFIEQAGAELNIGTNRYGRKCREYAEKLLEVCISDKERIEETIKNNARNWAPERISAVDYAILTVAIAEMLNFTAMSGLATLSTAYSMQ